MDTSKTLDSTEVLTSYKNLKYVERDFRIIKSDDLDLRPIHHYREKRVRAHVLICTLAAYLTWHLREALTEPTFTDQHIPDRDDPVAPAQRSPHATTKDATKRTPNGLPLHRYKDLLQHLSTLDRQVINFNGQRIEKLTSPTPVQRRAFELLGAPVPTTLR
jgi:transposase